MAREYVDPIPGPVLGKRKVEFINATPIFMKHGCHTVKKQNRAIKDLQEAGVIVCKIFGVWQVDRLGFEKFIEQKTLEAQNGG